MNDQISHLTPAEGAEVQVLGRDGHVRPWREIRAEIFGRTLRASSFSMREAAVKLGVGRTTLYRWLSDPWT
jgi:DNA-binding NtrC family response regulator